MGETSAALALSSASACRIPASLCLLCADVQLRGSSVREPNPVERGLVTNRESRWGRRISRKRRSQPDPRSSGRWRRAPRSWIVAAIRSKTDRTDQGLAQHLPPIRRHEVPPLVDLAENRAFDGPPIYLELLDGIRGR